MFDGMLKQNIFKGQLQEKTAVLEFNIFGCTFQVLKNNYGLFLRFEQHITSPLAIIMVYLLLQ